MTARSFSLARLLACLRSLLARFAALFLSFSLARSFSRYSLILSSSYRAAGASSPPPPPAPPPPPPRRRCSFAAAPVAAAAAAVASGSFRRRCQRTVVCRLPLRMSMLHTDLRRFVEDVSSLPLSAMPAAPPTLRCCCRLPPLGVILFRSLSDSRSQVDERLSTDRSGRGWRPWLSLSLLTFDDETVTLLFSFGLGDFCTSVSKTSPAAVA